MLASFFQGWLAWSKVLKRIFDFSPLFGAVRARLLPALTALSLIGKCLAGWGLVGHGHTAATARKEARAAPRRWRRGISSDLRTAASRQIFTHVAGDRHLATEPMAR
jgi:hypothetical protein